MAQTEHYGIRQWEAWEVPGHTDLNGTLGTIDAALAALESGKLAGVFGSYTGNDASSRTISLGFTPRAVILVNAEGRMCTGSTGYDICGGVFFPGGKHTNCGVATGGFRVSDISNSGLSTNSSDSNMSPYFYLAIR